jgi:hypothetical protein
VPNPAGALIAGSYVQVQLPVKSNAAALLLPNNALLFRPEGPRVAVVDGAGRVHLQLVRLGTDFGNSVEILSGASVNDRIVLNPADSLADGDIVAPVESSPASSRDGEER